MGIYEGRLWHLHFPILWLVKITFIKLEFQCINTLSSYSFTTALFHYLIPVTFFLPCCQINSLFYFHVIWFRFPISVWTNDICICLIFLNISPSFPSIFLQMMKFWCSLWLIIFHCLCVCVPRWWWARLVQYLGSCELWHNKYRYSHIPVVFCLSPLQVYTNSGIAWAHCHSDFTILRNFWGPGRAAKGPHRKDSPILNLYRVDEKMCHGWK